MRQSTPGVERDCIRRRRTFERTNEKGAWVARERRGTSKRMYCSPCRSPEQSGEGAVFQKAWIL